MAKIQVALPVSIRWVCTTNTAITRNLTIAADTPSRFDDRSPASYLTKACGRKGIEQSNFTIDSHPQDHGIIDALSQNFRIMPIACKFDDNDRVSTAAEESKIRLISKPDLLGHFVVCLPDSHKGGYVTISDKGHSSVFDWSDSANQCRHWVAMTKNCAVKISPVTEGTQILLVYELIITKQIGDGLGSGNIIDPKLSPLYQGVKDSLLEPGFMKTDIRTHTSTKMGKRLPFALRGVDMVFNSVFKSLGLNVQVRPILDPDDIDMVLENRFEKEFGDGYNGYDDYGELPWLCIGENESMYFDEYNLLSFDQGLDFTWPMEERHGDTFLNSPYSGGKKPRELAVVMMEDSSEEDMMYEGYSDRHSQSSERLHSLVGKLVHVPKLAHIVMDF
ncbi:uncharacterized protein RCO7_08013 [Rhynchosporium graminicola]|uniref:Uncharacterized protein n=1 Tax=Rhynchosporium graminicola TaxID=2792576 RepID=A0A1E1K6U2_9HELO|nr:uncharacterized protein RCO7_08013 [Rhynchosporium commune]